MEEIISSESSVISTASATTSVTESAYDGVESVVIQDYAIGQNASIGIGVGASGVLVSLAVAGLIRFFSSL